MKTVCLSEKQYYGKLNKQMTLGFAHLSVTGYKSKEKLKKHYHENSYLSLLINGTYSEICKEDTKFISSGELIFRPQSYDHANEFSNTPGRCFNIEFENNFSGINDLKLKLPSRNIHYKGRVFPEIYKAFVGFTEGNNSENIEELLLQWLFEINNTRFPESNIPWINKVKHILETETQYHHSLQSISERVFVHPVYLAGCFKKKTGLTLGRYQTEAKLNKAIQQVFNSKLSVTEIALNNGFFDSAHFIKQFKAAYGITPLHFKKKL
ncbi:MAG: helix-turn-helix transcriptional regulator [Bacteroidia bacterium]|nr:helix-turn-helix transcriptional regulator [Bacteroidia bacterium]